MARRLLAVDDEIELLLILVQLARARGYEASCTSDPSTVLQHVRRISPDVVLLDLNMPRVDGRDLIARIRAEPSAPAVVVMTGWLDEHTDALCRTYGATDIVHKPFDADDLFRRVEAAVRASGPR